MYITWKRGRKTIQTRILVLCLMWIVFNWKEIRCYKEKDVPLDCWALLFWFIIYVLCSCFLCLWFNKNKIIYFSLPPLTQSLNFMQVGRKGMKNKKQTMESKHKFILYFYLGCLRQVIYWENIVIVRESEDEVQVKEGWEILPSNGQMQKKCYNKWALISALSPWKDMTLKMENYRLISLVIWVYKLIN